MRLFAPASVLLVAWGALAFGAEYAWAYAPLLVLCVAVGVIGLLTGPRAANQLRPMGAALGLVLAAGALQIAPLPEPVLAAISPARWDHDYQALYANVVPRSPDGAAYRIDRLRSISVAPSRTLLGLAFLAGLSIFFVGATQALRVVRASGIVRGLMAVGLIVALVGIVQAAAASERVYGVWYPRHNLHPSAPHINENHFAGWIVMVVSLSSGYLCGLLARSMRGLRTAWRDRLEWLSSRDASEVLLTGFALVVMALALVITLSRSGIGCLATALCVSGWWAARRQAGALRVLLPAGLTAVLLVAVGWGGIDAVGEEFARTSWSDVGGRAGIWHDTTRIIQDFPLVGTGLNTYGIAMLAYQTYSADAHAVEAHNDYLQLAAEGGLLLSIPVVIAILLFVREVRSRFREAADDTMTYWLRVGAVTGLVAIGLQEVVDFSLQMPGNAALFVLLAAIAVHTARKPTARAEPGVDE